MQFRPAVKPQVVSGFTLVELSIVLVIIGLIIGGVLVGRDLISVAAIRAQVSQIEKYQSAVNTFRGKYGYLPGDIPDPVATQYGFVSRGINPGEGDGNGVIEGNCCDGPTNNVGISSRAGETIVFWMDLSSPAASQLIEGNFSAASETVASNFSGAAVSLYYPHAKMGRGNYLYVYSGGVAKSSDLNFFGISAVTQVGNVNGAQGGMASTPAMTVAEAYNIDKKIDDAAPQLGRVTARYVNANISASSQYPVWAAGGGVEGAESSQDPTNNPTSGSTTTCYDNAGGSGPQQYSIEVSGGANLNCALSFQFQ